MNGSTPAQPRRVVLVTGLSGAGKGSILRVLEDLGYEAVDNLPLPLMEELVERGDGPIAIGIDTRSRGFEPTDVLRTIARLRGKAALHFELVFAWADEQALLRRFTETRRRHPLAPTGRVTDGVAAEVTLTMQLREAADLLIDTSELNPAVLRRMIEQRFSRFSSGDVRMAVSLMSFAYPSGLPREAELVFDVRFLRNPHYVASLRSRTGLDEDVAAYVAADPDFAPFMAKITDLLTMLLPRFVQEGKKYVMVAIGCTGGQHRSVHVAQLLATRLRALGDGQALSEPGAGSISSGADGPAASDMTAQKRLANSGWRISVTHRELIRGAAGDRAAKQATELAALDNVRPSIIGSRQAREA